MSNKALLIGGAVIIASSVMIAFAMKKPKAPSFAAENDSKMTQRNINEIPVSARVVPANSAQLINVKSDKEFQEYTMRSIHPQVVAFVNMASCGHCVKAHPAIVAAAAKAKVPFVIVDQSVAPSSIATYVTGFGVPRIVKMFRGKVTAVYSGDRSVTSLVAFADAV